MLAEQAVSLAEMEIPGIMSPFYYYFAYKLILHCTTLQHLYIFIFLFSCWFFVTQGSIQTSAAELDSLSNLVPEAHKTYELLLQSQPKVSGHPQKKALPRFPSFNVATMMSTFLSIFF